MRVCICFMLLLFFNTVKSQDLFNVKYTGRDGTKYDCLFVADSSDEVYVRMKFNKNGVSYLADIKYQQPVSITLKGKEFFYSKVDSAFKNKYGKSNCFLSTKVLTNFKPPCFIYYLNSGTKNSNLPYVTDDAINFTNIREVTTCKQLNKKDIREGGLNAFYTLGEEKLYAIKSIYRANLPDPVETPSTKIPPTLHFIMVTNSADKKIGVSCIKDRENLQREMFAITTTLRIDYKPYFINAQDFSKPKLLSKLDLVKPASDDIVIFSYSGHGARWEDQKDEYPFMELWVTQPFSDNPKTQAELDTIRRIVMNNSLGLSEVFEIIKTKSARLNIVLGDLCNTSIGVSRPLITKNILTFGNWLRNGSEFMSRDPEKLRKLFITARGNLIFTAAKPNEKAAGNQTVGGYFTHSFVNAIRSAGSYNNSPPFSWEKIINQTIEGALQTRKKATPEELQNGLRFMTITD